MKSNYSSPWLDYDFNLLNIAIYIRAVLLSCLVLFAVRNATAQLIVRTDFNREKVWLKDYRASEKWNNVSAKSFTSGVAAKVNWGKTGTIDVANTVTPSEGLTLTVENTSAVANWNAALTSGLLAANNKESEPGKLTFSFDHWVSSIRPVVIQIESFDAAKNRTGGLETTVFPATSKHFMRSAFELADMRVSGTGKFNPVDPFVQFSFYISNGNSEEGTAGSKDELRIDNLMYASPAYYVSTQGRDINNGRTEKTAFATPQKALDIAKPGDIILLMNGSYKGSKNANAVADFRHAGLPSAWITLKNYPGHKPLLLAHGKDGVRIEMGTDSTAKESPLLSYIEIRGLHIRGNADAAEKLYPADLGTMTKNTEAKGINICGEKGPTRMYHHFRVADNLVEYCGSYGIFTHTVDYLLVENNIMRYNNYTTVDFCSAGFACMMYADFDKADNVTKIVVRNNQAYANQRKTIKRQGTPKIFNGNGMLFDANCEDYIAPDFYLGRTLIQNNLVYGNGGGGIQNWGSHRLDIVNNTIYHNGLTPELKWGNIGLDFCKDVRLINNIVVAQDDRPLDSWMLSRADRDTSNIVRINNLYYGGGSSNIKGAGDIVADPLFVNPSLDPSVADFNLKPGSPAINAGYQGHHIVPIGDLSGRLGKTVDRGAYKLK